MNISNFNLRQKREKGCLRSQTLAKLQIKASKSFIVFEERGKPEYQGKNLSDQRREPTNSIHRLSNHFPSKTGSWRSRRFSRVDGGWLGRGRVKGYFNRDYAVVSSACLHADDWFANILSHVKILKDRNMIQSFFQNLIPKRYFP